MLGRRFSFPTMTEIDHQLPQALRSHRRRRTLAVIAANPRQLARLELEQSRWSAAHVVSIVGRPAADLHGELAVLSNLALVVDLRGPSAQLSAFEHLFFHLDPSGAWVAVRTPRIPGRPEPLVRLARGLQDPGARRRLGRRWREHRRVVTSIEVTPSTVVLGKRRRHRLTLGHDEAPALLRSREPDLHMTELARLDGGTLDTTGRTHDYGTLPALRVPEVLRYPAHVLRRYDGVVSLPRGPLAYHHRSVLPDSFRWYLTPQPRVPGMLNVGEHFGLVEDKRAAEELEGSYFHFLYANPGHFGHVMTEALSRLWGWWPAKEADPSLKILCRRRPATDRPGPESTLLPAFGIAEDDIVWIDGGVRVTSLVGCTPMWHNAPPFYAHPAIRESWARLRTGLSPTDEVETPPCIFVTRRIGNRPCSNVEDVERFFADRGFAIVAPEQLSVPEQVRIFAQARVIAGLGGAGMFNLAYARSVETVIVLNQSAYQARNEQLFAAVHGAQLHTFWSAPVHDHPPGGYLYRAHQSPWTFDFARNGRQLGELLHRLVQ